MKIKRWLANKLVALARRIDPPNPNYLAFVADRLSELVITGKSFIKITHVNPMDMAKDEATK